MQQKLNCTETKTVPWEILRKGTRDHAEWSNYIKETASLKPRRTRVIIARHQFIDGFKT